jgi:hypothetical protein
LAPNSNVTGHNSIEVVSDIPLKFVSDSREIVIEVTSFARPPPYRRRRLFDCGYFE